MNATLSLIVCCLVGNLCFAQNIYRTTADGTWEGANWTPCPPPTSIGTSIIIIEHHIIYTTTDKIDSWNSPQGKIQIENSGALKILTNNQDIYQTNGFELINHGTLWVNVGTGKYRADTKSALINTGKLKIDAQTLELMSDISLLFQAPASPSLSIKD